MARFALSLLVFILATVSCMAQKKGDTFKTNKAYCDHLEKKYDIPRELVVYVSEEGAPIHELGKFGQMLLVTDQKIATIEEVRAKLASLCAPEKLFKQVTQQAIAESSGEEIDFSRFVFKEVATGERVDLWKEDKFVLYIFSRNFGNSGLSLIKQRSQLEKELGYKSFVLTIDGAYLDEIKDVDKTPVVIK